MKKILLFFVISGFVLCQFSQAQSGSLKLNRELKVLKPVAGVDNPVIGIQPPNTTVSAKTVLADPITAVTKYDFQTNGAVLPHLYRYMDGTMASVATMSHLNDFSDRGTGYNYFNGTSWGPQPSQRIENVRTGWPSYAPLGENGEIVVTHESATGPLVICRRDTKGTGTWTETELPPPSDATGTGMIWAKIVTNGTPRTNVHILCLTGPVANGGALYEDMDGALLYNRSLDGGTTWDGWQILDGMTSDEYLGFSADSYAWAEPKANTLAFTAGENWMDQFIMKSTDNGDNWTKTVIWPCPYNKWEGGDTTGTFWCVDGTMAAALDNNGKVHVTMGLMRANGDEAGEKYWYPFTDYLLYWNEDMPTWPDVLDTAALNAGGNIIGWVQDTMVWYAQASELAYYYVSMSSFPSMLIDENNNIFVVWSGVTTLRDNNSYMLRHLFGRQWASNQGAWIDKIVDITDDFLYNWSECVYPSLAPYSYDNNLYIQFQGDAYAGTFIQDAPQGQTEITSNDIIIITTPIIVGIKEPGTISLKVSQNTPNPFHGNSVVNVNLDKGADLSMAVYSVTGQRVMEINKGKVNSGNHYFNIDGSQLKAGVYFYTVKVDNESVTKKMIVD